MESVVGVIFMGTPHAGADLAVWASLLTNVAKIGKNANRDILDVLNPGSQVLAGLQQEFHILLERRRKDGKRELKIYCIFEELLVTGVGMVSFDHRYSMQE